MKDAKLNEVLQSMQSYLDNVQLEQLKRVLQHAFWNCSVTMDTEPERTDSQNEKLVDLFLSAKRIEGCSEKTLRYYKATIDNVLRAIEKDVRRIDTEDLRQFLTEYQHEKSGPKNSSR